MSKIYELIPTENETSWKQIWALPEWATDQNLVFQDTIAASEGVEVFYRFAAIAMNTQFYTTYKCAFQIKNSIGYLWRTVA